jgi:hypothetical protein
VHRSRIKLVSLTVGIVAAVGTVFGVTPARAATCTTSAQWGVCFPANSTQNFEDDNNVWNAAADPGWSQTLAATTSTQWTATAKMRTVTGNPVISYPEAKLQFYQSQKPLADWNSIVGEWHSGLPTWVSGDRYESAYDLWLDDGPGTSDGKEVMIWTQNGGQYPAGSDTHKQWDDPLYGTGYEVYANSGTVTFVIDTGSHSGSVDIKDALQYAINLEWPGDPGYNYQFDYGFEVVTTQNVAKVFNLYGLLYNMN